MHVSPPAFSPILSPRRAVAPYLQKPDTGAEPPLILAILVDESVPL